VLSIKIAASYVGGERLRAVASEAEKAAQAGQLSVFKTHMATMKEEFERLKHALAKEL
jgi:HPt (histidine-containing phosphotransfer) domain-containing protein